MLTSLSDRYSTDPFYKRCALLEEPRSLTVAIEERYPLHDLVLLVSYNVRISYRSETEYTVVGYDLVREKRDLTGKLVYSATPLEWITDTALQAGLRSMFDEDVLAPEVGEIITDSITADMRKHDEAAREYAADLRRDLPAYTDDEIDF